VYSKALVAVAGAVVSVAAIFGVNLDPAAVATVVSAVTAVLVYFVPNG